MITYITEAIRITAQSPAVQIRTCHPRHALRGWRCGWTRARRPRRRGSSQEAKVAARGGPGKRDLLRH